MDRYEIVRQIGKGSFGSVYLVQRRSDGCQFVMKKMPVSRSVPAKEMESYHNEVKLLSELQHPGIVAYLESFLDQQTAQMCIIMSYCEGGDLAHFLSSRASPSSPSPPSPLPEAEILYHFVQMLLALLFMHDKHILHRDLKTANIFIKNGLIQLGDLGISKALSSSSSFASTCIGTPYYMSPELFKSRPYNHKSDVWALGCVLYELCAGGRHAFDAASLNGLAAKIMKGGYAGIGSGYSRQTQQLIAAMLQVNPSLRPSVREILCMPPVRRSLTRFVHVVLRHRDFWRDRDVDNFTRQIQRLGMQDMIAEISSSGPAPALPAAAAAVVSPAPAAGGGMLVLGVGGRKDVRKALDLLGEEEREKVRMEKKLAELREMQAERERKLRDREKAKDRGERRRSGGKEQPALPASQPPAAAAAAAVLERRREEEQRRREEEARRRRERERERERLREWEKEKERQQREAEERRRRQAEQSRERERRQWEERERDRERAAVQVRVLQRERESERLQRRLYDEKAEQERQEMERIRSEGEELKRHLQQLQDTEEEEQGAAAGSEKERVMQRKDRERRQREEDEMQRLRAARRDYREEKSRALERKEAVEGKRAAAAAGLEERAGEDSDVRADAAREEEEEDAEAAEAAERVAMEAGKLRIEQLTAHLQDYGKRLQTLRTTMQVTALIQESLTEDGDDDEQDETEAGDEAEEEAEAAHASLLVSVEERMRALGRECVRVLGRELFLRLYGHIAECREAGVGEEEIEDGIRQREEARGAAAAADERWRRWRLVDQLIFMENHCDDAAEEQRAIQ